MLVPNNRLRRERRRAPRASFLSCTVTWTKEKCCWGMMACITCDMLGLFWRQLAEFTQFSFHVRKELAIYSVLSELWEWVPNRCIKKYCAQFSGGSSKWLPSLRHLNWSHVLNKASTSTQQWSTSLIGILKKSKEDKLSGKYTRRH